jgi:hypothetical protein
VIRALKIQVSWYVTQCHLIVFDVSELPTYSESKQSKKCRICRHIVEVLLEEGGVGKSVLFFVSWAGFCAF